MTDLTDRWVTIDEAALITGRSRRTITRWLTLGRLTVVRGPAGRPRIHVLTLLTLERATRRATNPGRPGARPPCKRIAGALGLPETRNVVPAHPSVTPRGVLCDQSPPAVPSRR